MVPYAVKHRDNFTCYLYLYKLNLAKLCSIIIFTHKIINK